MSARELREEFGKAMTKAVADRLRTAGVSVEVFRGICPRVDQILRGEMPDAFDMLCLAAACGCRVADIIRDAGGAG